jgi:stage II sporulation protein D
MRTAHETLQHAVAGGRTRRVLATAAALATVAAAALAATARADYAIEGRGWGHGVGMSQYGAYGYALREGRDFRWILGHYYPGTNVGRVAAARMRVRLRRTSRPKVCSASTLRDARGRRVRLSERRVYRFSAWGADGLRVADASSGRTRARVRAPVRVTGGSTLCLRGLAENGVRDGSYRGALTLHRDGRSVLVVGDVSLEHYLYGVVAAEMPASWAAEALKAQAVVARSYALRSRRPTELFDVYADVRSQVYRGVAAEDPAAVAAVRATRALAVRYGVEIAQTFFHSTSGGRTASNEEGFGGLPVPYLRSVEDPYDDLSPVHVWDVRLTDRQAQRKLREVLLGDLEDIVVAAATPSGRVDRVDVVGSEGTIQVSGRELRRLLELRSHWFTVRREEP